MLSSPKVSSSNFSQNRTDPLTLDPYLLMATMKQPTSKKDKLAITSTLFKMETTFAARRDRITIFEEPRRFSMEKTEKVMTTYTPAQLKCASAPDKLVPFTMVLAILFLDHKLAPFTMVSAIMSLDHELVPLTMVPAILNLYHELAPIPGPDYATLHTCAMMDPALDTVSNPAQLHTRVTLDPVLDTVPNPAALHTLAKILTLKDLFSFGCLTPKEHCRFSTEKTEGERKKERERRERSKGAPVTSLALYPAQAVT